MPRAENDTHYMGLSPAEALSLASIAIDFRVSEVVDLTRVVTGFVPKSIFLRWYSSLADLRLVGR